jgi:hypothetical protein
MIGKPQFMKNVMSSESLTVPSHNWAHLKISCVRGASAFAPTAGIGSRTRTSQKLAGLATGPIYTGGVYVV